MAQAVWPIFEADALAPMADAAAHGDARATRMLLEQIGPAVLTVIRAVLGYGHPDVDDVAQESFLAIVRALKMFRYESSVAHFAKRIAIQRARASLRHRRAAPRDTAVTISTEDDLLAARDASPLDTVITARQLRLVRELVVQLPEEQSETLVLKIVLGHSAEEIAEITQTPVDTVRSRLRAARATLRLRMAEVGEIQ